MTPRADLIDAIHTERAALADDLAGLGDAQWATPSLCGRWCVEEVVAHLVAGASLGFPAWLVSMVRARFDDTVHNGRNVARFRGATPAETLARFRAVVRGPAGPGPVKYTAAWLGEIVVHGEDVRRPLGLVRVPPVVTTTAVADLFAARDFTVLGHSRTEGLRLEATDGPFAAGSGPTVSGTTLALTMAMAGRPGACDDLTGDGVAALRARP